MDQAKLQFLRLAIIAGAAITLSACVTYHQPRYGSDGVYFDQFHPQPRTIVVADPFFYPYRSLDYFYFSQFGYPYRWGGSFGIGWPYRYTGGRHYAYGGHAQPPLQGDVLLDERLRAMDARGRGSESGTTGVIGRPTAPTRLGPAALRIQRQGDSHSMRAPRIQSPPANRTRPASQRSSSPAQRSQHSRPAPRMRPAPPRPSSASRPARSVREIDPR